MELCSELLTIVTTLSIIRFGRIRHATLSGRPLADLYVGIVAVPVKDIPIERKLAVKFDWIAKPPRHVEEGLIFDSAA